MTTPNDLPSVGTEDARALAAMLIVHAGDHKDVAYECDMNPVHTLNWKHYETNLSASKALLNLVSERDALAGRVAELEEMNRRQTVEVAEKRELRDRLFERLDAQRKRIGDLEAALQGFYRNSNRHDWPADIYDAATAALSATTPESKP